MQYPFFLNLGRKKIITYKISLFKLMIKKMMPLDCNKMYSN